MRLSVFQEVCKIQPIQFYDPLLNFIVVRVIVYKKKKSLLLKLDKLKALKIEKERKSLKSISIHYISLLIPILQKPDANRIQ